jgi:hypothetical protein
MGVMTDRRVRHIIIMDGDAMTGVVSIGDVVKRKIAQAEAAAKPQAGEASRFSRAGLQQPTTEPTRGGSIMVSVSDESPRYSPPVAAPAPPTQRKLAPPANRIDWNHPQVVIGPPQPTGKPIENSHLAARQPEVQETFRFDPTPAQQASHLPSEPPGQFVQGHEADSVKSWEMPATGPTAVPVTLPQRNLSPITACRILGLKPATEQR